MGLGLPCRAVRPHRARSVLKKLISPAWAMLEYGWYPLLLFIATPWFLLRLGAENYGHWMLLTATVGLGGVLNAGTGAATIKAISAGIGRAGQGDIEHTVRASLAIAMLGGGILALLVFCVFWFAGGTLLARMGAPTQVQLTGAAAALLIWLEQLDNVFSSAMKGAEQFGQAARIEIVAKTTQILAGALVLMWWPALSALYAALLTIGVLRLVAKMTIARRLLGLSDLRPSRVGAIQILRFAKWGWLQGVGGVLFGVADRMLVGSLLGAASLTYYSIASQLAMQIHAVSAAGVSVIFPMVSRRLESGHHFSLWRVTKLTMSGNVLLSTVLAVVLLFFGRELLIYWLDLPQALPIISVLPYLVFAYWLLALNVTPHYILLSLGRFRLIALTNLAAGLALILFIPSIAVTYDLTGVAAVRILYGAIILINFIPLAFHLQQTKRI